jgi:(p)ppGpp synthase/HD superfamily hydrolase
MRNKLIQFVKEQHGEQVRKYTGEPYFNHVYAVAVAAEKSGVKYGFEIGLCHDLLEDTGCDYDTLINALIEFGCFPPAAIWIADRVKELTDKFTTEAYPYLNRQLRKQCEALRLHTISREAQIVKAFDLIDNTSSIIQHDKGFAQKYIPEKRAILIGFKKLPVEIHSQVWNCLFEAEEQLEIA